VQEWLDRRFRDLVTSILDADASKPKTLFQTTISRIFEIAANLAMAALTGLFGYVVATIFFVGLKLPESFWHRNMLGLGIDLPKNQLALGGFLAAMIVCSLIGVRSMQAMKRYQVFAIIGMANVASALLENTGALLQAGAKHDFDGIAKHLWAMIKSFVN
jgi:hypothetical protein